MSGLTNELFDVKSPFYNLIPLWIKEYGKDNVYEMKIPFEGEIVYAYFHSPDRIFLKEYYSKQVINDMEAKEFLFNTCRIEGGVEQVILDNDALYVSAVYYIRKIINKYNGYITRDIELFNTGVTYFNRVKNIKDIYQLEMRKDDDLKYIYFKKPDRKILMNFYNIASTNIMDANEYIYKTCKYLADPEIEKNDDLYISTILKCEGIIDFYSADLKKKEDELVITDKSSAFRKIDALILYHFNIDPQFLTDEKYLEYWQNLEWITKKTNN